MKKEFHDADCDEDADEVGEEADRNQVFCFRREKRMLATISKIQTVFIKG
jgi:hypothetical protein